MVFLAAAGEPQALEIDRVHEAAWIEIGEWRSVGEGKKASQAFYFG